MVLPDGLGAGRNVDTLPADPHYNRVRDAERVDRGRRDAAGAARWRMRLAVWGPAKPPSALCVSREMDRTRVTHLEMATRMPSTFAARSSVDSRILAIRTGRRRVETDNVRFLAHGSESACQVVCLLEAQGWVVLE